ERDPQALVEERELPATLAQHVVLELDGLENLRVRLEADERTSLLRRADHLDGGHRLALAIDLPVLLPVSEHASLELLAQGAHDRHADPVEAARDLIALVV